MYYKDLILIPKIKNILKSQMFLPYYFSDHKNKSFENQYEYLKRRYSVFWKIYPEVVWRPPNMVWRQFGGLQTTFGSLQATFG